MLAHASQRLRGVVSDAVRDGKMVKRNGEPQRRGTRMQTSRSEKVASLPSRILP